MSYEVDNPEIRELMRSIARSIDAQIPKGWGFALFLCSYEEECSNIFYISSANRDGIIGAIKEWITRQEQPPAAR